MTDYNTIIVSSLVEITNFPYNLLFKYICCNFVKPLEVLCKIVGLRENSLNLIQIILA